MLLKVDELAALGGGRVVEPSWSVDGGDGHQGGWEQDKKLGLGHRDVSGRDNSNRLTS